MMPVGRMIARRIRVSVMQDVGRHAIHMEKSRHPFTIDCISVVFDRPADAAHHRGTSGVPLCNALQEDKHT